MVESGFIILFPIFELTANSSHWYAHTCVYCFLFLIVSLESTVSCSFTQHALIGFFLGLGNVFILWREIQSDVLIIMLLAFLTLELVSTELLQKQYQCARCYHSGQTVGSVFSRCKGAIMLSIKAHPINIIYNHLFSEHTVVHLHKKLPTQLNSTEVLRSPCNLWCAVSCRCPAYFLLTKLSYTCHWKYKIFVSYSALVVYDLLLLDYLKLLILKTKSCWQKLQGKFVAWITCCKIWAAHCSLTLIIEKW